MEIIPESSKEMRWLCRRGCQAMPRTGDLEGESREEINLEE